MILQCTAQASILPRRGRITDNATSSCTFTPYELILVQTTGEILLYPVVSALTSFLLVLRGRWVWKLHGHFDFVGAHKEELLGSTKELLD
jgi:hypothetical protein